MLRSRFRAWLDATALSSEAGDLIALLRDAGATLGSEDTTAELLCRAGASANNALLSRLLRAGADPDACDYDRRTALHLAAAEGHVDTVRLLVEGGARLSFVDRWGVDALIEAAKHRQEAVVRYLIGAGADVNTTDTDGHTALRVAVAAKADACIGILKGADGRLGGDDAVAEMMCRAGAAGDDAMLRRLLSAGASPDSCDYDRRTALHLAAAEGHVSAVRLLVEGGAQVGFKDRWEQAALGEAKNAAHTEVVAYLQSLQKILVAQV